MQLSYFRLALVSAMVLLSGCGGGGSSGDASTSRTPTSLSGRISIAENSAIDSDTNDPRQTNRLSNNAPAQAQKLTAPVSLIGHVNLPHQGNQDGPSFSAGDEHDVYQVALQAGQVVEIEFSADPQKTDLDLFVINANHNFGGESVSRTSRYECIRITQDDTYYVNVSVYKGASIYGLRITPLHENPTCDNSTRSITPTSMQLIAQRSPSLTTSQATTDRQTSSARTNELQTALSHDVPELLTLPRATANRTQVLASTDTDRKSALSVHPASAELSPLEATLRDLRDSAMYSKHLMDSGLFDYIERNQTMQLTDTTLVGAYPPNDPFYVQQRWHYNMINLPAAMNKILTLSPQPTQRPLVAVIDNGLVIDHPDLNTQIAHQASFQNSGTFSNDANASAAPSNNSAQFHGTHVAGTIAASSFDGYGVAGVAPMAQLMPINVFSNGSASNYDVVQAILYAAGLPNSSGTTPPQRADIINMSLGATAYAPCSSAQANAIARARSAGTLVVVAAGNESNNRLSSPANCPGAIAVGALNAGRQKTGYSNTGEGLMVSAPGGDTTSAVFSTLATFDAQGHRLPSFGGMRGTSMATPHVVGVMALMRFVNPAITPDQISYAFAAGRLTDDMDATGYDVNTGWGLINAQKAVDVAIALKDSTSPNAPVGQIIAQPASLNVGALRTSIDLTLIANQTTQETLLSLTSPSSAITVTPKQINATTKLGTYTIHIDRHALPSGNTVVDLVATTSSARQFNIALSVQKNPSTAAPNIGTDLGPLYVLIYDADTQQQVGSTQATFNNGAYLWQYSGTLPTRVVILGGTDIDNDDVLCKHGEACGAYTTLGQQPSPIAVDSQERSNLNFVVTPF